MIDTTTARRKAMAEAIREELDKSMPRTSFNTLALSRRLATAADEAREQFEKEKAK